MGKRLTHDEFVKKLLYKNEQFANGHIELLSEYISKRERIQCRCKIDGHTWSPTADSLLNGRGCPKCGRKIASDKKRLSYAEFIDRLSCLGQEMMVIGKYVDTQTKVKMQCLKGHVWDAIPAHLFDGIGCPYCGGLKVWPGFNDLWTTHPDIAKMLKNKEDGFKYSKASSKQATFVCPDCGYEMTKQIVMVYTDGIACPMCSDGISYPNKFGRAFLKQLPITNLICEYHPLWAKPYFYDNYFEYDNQKYILEMDGGFHYAYNSLSKTPLEQLQVIDEIKNQLAMQNNIHIIRVNCLKSDKAYISTNIMNSELNQIFDLTQIDWDICDKKAQKSLVKETCDLYMSGLYEKSDITAMLNINISTVNSYIRRGVQLGLCQQH